MNWKGKVLENKIIDNLTSKKSKVQLMQNSLISFPANQNMFSNGNQTIFERLSSQKDQFFCFNLNRSLLLDLI